MTVGIHIIADFYGVNSDILARVEDMARIFEDTVKYAGVTKLAANYYQFEPFGCSGVVLLAESHMSFHTWPEYGLVTLDFYTCGPPEQAHKAYEYLENVLKPKRVEYHKLVRGRAIHEEVPPKPIVGPLEVVDSREKVMGH